MSGAPRRGWPEAPSPLEIARRSSVGNYPMFEVFSGLAEVPPFTEYPMPARRVRAIAEGTTIQVIPDDTWMYVAPHEVPSWAKKFGWTPFSTPTNCIVVGRRHLARSRSAILYLDILHEFFHILQREEGRELWDLSKGYVDSPTELEAYRFSVKEARRLGIPDSYLRSYLKVEWVGAKDHLRLLRNLGVNPPR